MLQGLIPGFGGVTASGSSPDRREFDSYIVEAVRQLRFYDEEVQGLMEAWVHPRNR